MLLDESDRRRGETARLLVGPILTERGELALELAWLTEYRFERLPLANDCSLW